MVVNDFSMDELAITEEKIHYIESILNTKIMDGAITTTTIDPVVAGRWYGNFYGLLYTELGISSNALYIHLRINGLIANTDYIGDINISVLDPATFVEIEEAFLRKKAYENSLG